MATAQAHGEARGVHVPAPVEWGKMQKMFLLVVLGGVLMVILGFLVIAPVWEALSSWRDRGGKREDEPTPTP